MKYTGNLCPGCGEQFTDSDDIVVCPECGTPQHRECYDKENRCVSAELHGDGYTWQGKVNNVSPLPKEKTEAVSCPNCGYENPVGSPMCKQCGMKFTLFGMNVVDAMHAEEKRTSNPNRDIPDYEAPFTLGTGKGFDARHSDGLSPDAKQIQELLTSVLTGDTEGTNSENSRINLGGPFPESDEIGGVMTNNIGNFIGTNAMSYIAKFRKLQNGSKLSFNFAAFFFSPYWFFYRKLYKAGIVVMTLMLAMNILATPYIYQMLDIYEKLAPMLEAGTMNEAQFAEIYSELTAASGPMAIFFLASILLQLICGFTANIIYKKYVLTYAAAAQNSKGKTAAMSYVVKYGGASILIGGASYFAYQLITMLISTIL